MSRVFWIIIVNISGGVVVIGGVEVKLAVDGGFIVATGHFESVVIIVETQLVAILVVGVGLDATCGVVVGPMLIVVIGVTRNEMHIVLMTELVVTSQIDSNTLYRFLSVVIVILWWLLDNTHSELLPASFECLQ